MLLHTSPCSIVQHVWADHLCIPCGGLQAWLMLACIRTCLGVPCGFWSRHGDACSAGLVLMQLAVPKLRSTSGLKAFSKALQACMCDLGAWRERERLSPAQSTLLDADDGAGWDLAQALLRPRKLEVTDFSFGHAHHSHAILDV